MQVKKNHWFVAAAMIAAAGAVMIFSPRRADAQYASPVRVMNSSAAPAIGSLIDESGRIPYQSDSNCSIPGSLCTVFFSAVPSGKRLVVEHISGWAAVASGTPTFLRYGRFSDAYMAPAAPMTVQAGAWYIADQNVHFYVDGGDTALVSFATTPGANIFDGGHFELTGYLLDCSAAPCAPIAH